MPRCLRLSRRLVRWWIQWLTLCLFWLKDYGTRLGLLMSTWVCVSRELGLLAISLELLDSLLASPDRALLDNPVGYAGLLVRLCLLNGVPYVLLMILCLHLAVRLLMKNFRGSLIFSRLSDGRVDVFDVVLVIVKLGSSLVTVLVPLEHFVSLSPYVDIRLSLRYSELRTLA